MKKTYFIIFFISLLASVALAFLRAYSFTLATAIISTVYAIATYFTLNRYGKVFWQVIFIAFLIFLGYEFLIIPLRITDWEETRISLWGDLCVLLSITLTTLFYHFKRNVLLLFFIPIWLYAIIIGSANWIEYASYGNLRKGINLSSLKLGTDGDSLRIGDIKMEYILLDFWSSTCGVCFKKFPEMQELHNQFKNNKDIIISSIFVVSKGESYKDAINLLHKDGYTFSVMGCTDWHSPLISTLGINGVPTVIILDKEKNVVFKGTLESAKKRLKKLQ